MFFNGQNNITGGVLNWTADNSAVTNVNMSVSNAILNVINGAYLKVDNNSKIADNALHIDENSTFENNTSNIIITDGSINGYYDGIKTSYGTYINNADGNIDLVGDVSGFKGKFIQNNGIINANDGSVLFGDMNLKKGKLILTGSANLNNTVFTSAATNTLKTLELVSNEYVSGILQKVINSSNKNLALVVTNNNSQANIVNLADLSLGDEYASLTLNDNVVYNGNISLTNSSTLNLNAQNYDILLNNNKITLNGNSSINVDGTHDVTLTQNTSIDGSGLINKSGSGKFIINTDASGINGAYTQNGGSTYITQDGKIFGGIKNINSGNLYVTSQSGLDYGNIKLGSDTNFVHTSTNFTGGNVDNSVVSFNGNNATAEFVGINGVDANNKPIKTTFNLVSSISNNIGSNKIAFNNTDVSLETDNYSDNTVYAFKNSILNLASPTSSTGRNIVFGKLESDNTKINFNIDFNVDSNGNVVLGSDKLSAVNNISNQVLKIGDIKLRNDHDNGSGILNKNLSANVLGSGLIFDDTQTGVITKIATTAYEYNVTLDTLTNKGITLLADQIADDLSLNKMNIMVGRRYFIFSNKDAETYNIKNSLDATADGEFTILGYDENNLGHSILSGKLSSPTQTSDKGSLFNIAGATTLRMEDLTIQDAYKDGEGSVISIGTSENENTSGATVSFVNNLIIQNTESSKDGGAIYNNGGQVELSSASIQSAKSGGNGGALKNTKGKIVLVQSVLNDNKAASDGGAIANSVDTTNTISYTKFDKNESGGNGGAISNKGVTSISNSSSFTNNKAGGKGGAIYTDNTLTVASSGNNDVLFENNKMNVNSSDETLNDIYMNGGTTTVNGTGGQIVVNSGIAGNGNIVKEGDSALVLGKDSVNNQYNGQYTQNSGTTTVNGTFFNGKNTVNNGTFNWNTDYEKSSQSEIKVLGGNVNITGKYVQNNTNDVIDSAAVTNIDSGALVQLNTGVVNLDTNGSNDEANYDKYKGNVVINGGTLNYSVKSNGLLQAQNGTVNLTGGNLTLDDVSIGGNTYTSFISDNTNLNIENNATLTLNSANSNIHIGQNTDYKGTLSLVDGTIVYDKTENGKIKAQGGTLLLKENSVLNLNSQNDLLDKNTAVIISNNSTVNNNSGTIVLNANDINSGKINLSPASTGTVVLDGYNSDTGIYNQAGGNLLLKNNSVLALDANHKISGGNVKIDNSLLQDNSTSADFNFNEMTIQNNGIFNAMHNFNILGSLNINNASAGTMNGMIDTNNIENLVINSFSTASFNIDLSPRNSLSDKFIIKNIKATNANNAYINIGAFSFLDSVPIEKEVKFDVFQSDNIADNIIFTSSENSVKSVLGDYKLFSLGGGSYLARLVSLNSPAYRGQVSTLAMFNQQLEVNNILLNHYSLIDNMSVADNYDRYANRYASILPQFAPYQSQADEGNLWYKSYVSFERLSMTNNINVSNNSYGSIIGADFPKIYLKHGWIYAPTAYIAYNGGHQTYDGTSLYQNGGQLGFMGTFLKDDFIASIMAYGGGYQNEMSVASATDSTGNWFAGTAAKVAYSFHPFKDIVLQPNALISYNVFGSQKWNSDFGAMSMQAGMLNGINVAPGINLILKKETWSLYLTAQYLFNINDQISGRAGNIEAEPLKMRHGYLEYGVGVTKRWHDRLNSYLQVTLRNGGRTGIGFQLGLQYNIDFEWFKKLIQKLK